jgi:hypothetical protein
MGSRRSVESARGDGDVMARSIFWRLTERIGPIKGYFCKCN